MTEKTDLLTEYTWEGDTLKAGDFVVAYEKGYHVVVGIERRFFRASDYRLDKNGKKAGDEDTPLVVYRRVISAKGKQVKVKKNIRCAWTFVFHVSDKWLQERKQEAVDEWDSVRDFREAFATEPW